MNTYLQAVSLRGPYVVGDTSQLEVTLTETLDGRRLLRACCGLVAGLIVGSVSGCARARQVIHYWHKYPIYIHTTRMGVSTRAPMRSAWQRTGIVKASQAGGLVRPLLVVANVCNIWDYWYFVSYLS